MKKIFSILLIFALMSCAYRPVLDDNYKFRNTPKEKWESDIDKCIEQADGYLKGRKLAKAGKEAVRKGATGAIIGGVLAFAISGNTNSLLKGVAIGAGAGAVLGAGKVAGEGKLSKDHIKQRYANNCLNRKGYNVIGWE